jgi:FixJ family two-component response regulator
MCGNVEKADLIEQGAEKFLAKPNRAGKLSMEEVRDRLRRARSEKVRKQLADELDRRFNRLWRLRFKS